MIYDMDANTKKSHFDIDIECWMLMLSGSVVKVFKVSGDENTIKLIHLIVCKQKWLKSYILNVLFGNKSFKAQ
jgi:hypothetical protein